MTSFQRRGVGDWRFFFSYWGVFVLLVLGRGERGCEANYMVHLHLQNFPKLKPSFIQLQVWGYTKIIECHSVLSLEQRPFLGCRQYDCLHSLSIEASRGTQTRINNFIPFWSNWIRNYSNGSMAQISWLPNRISLWLQIIQDQFHLVGDLGQKLHYEIIN